MKDLLKNKKKMTIIITIISILLVGSAIATSTYALFYTETAAANPNEFSTGLLSIEAVSKSENITLQNALPMEDSEGIETDAYIFTIRNLGNLDYTFDVKLLSMDSSLNMDLDPTYIKLKIDDEPVTTLSSLTDSKIKSNLSLGAKESMDISIKIWLDINTPNTEIGKGFISNIVIDGIAVYTEANHSPYYGGAELIYNLFSANSSVVNGGINYNIDTNNNLIEDTMSNIRYYGASPNNYIYFNCDEYPTTNCETWRIIGVVDGHLKLIRGNRIGAYSWDTSANTSAGNTGYGVNEWSQADIMKLLNPGNGFNIIQSGSGMNITITSINNSLYYDSKNGNCLNARSNAYTTCNFSSTGIKNDTTKNMIADITYNTGGFANNEVYPNELFALESSNSVGSNTNDGVTRTTSWTGKIALAYPSDYAYAADLSLCNDTLNVYNNSTCATNNWMKNIITNNGGTNGYLLNPVSGHASRVWHVATTGYLKYSASACNGYSVVPVLYLNKIQNIFSGTGTSEDPYTLSA